MAMTNFVQVEIDLCKGCRLCVESCPSDCLEMSTEINRLGYQHAVFVRHACTACGLCFYACPEPAAITVFKDEPMQASVSVAAGSGGEVAL